MATKVYLNQETHTYYDSKANVYPSVTTLLQQYKLPFDTELHAARVARRENVNPDVIKARWKEKNKQACDKGSAFHQRIHEYLLSVGSCLENPTFLSPKNFHNAAEVAFTHYLNQILFDGIEKEIQTEYILASDKYRFAGTIDFVVFNKPLKTCVIYDFKTNTLTDKYVHPLLPPLDFLTDTKKNLYTLQMLLYAVLLAESEYKDYLLTKCVLLSVTDNAFTPYTVDIKTLDPAFRKAVRHILEGVKQQLITV
jgi:ATP-dependent exoDNAse (exonuclease V) beta subunit